MLAWTCVCVCVCIFFYFGLWVITRYKDSEKGTNVKQRNVLANSKFNIYVALYLHVSNRLLHAHRMWRSTMLRSMAPAKSWRRRRSVSRWLTEIWCRGPTSTLRSWTNRPTNWKSETPFCMKSMSNKQSDPSAKLPFSLPYFWQWAPNRYKPLKMKYTI